MKNIVLLMGRLDVYWDFVVLMLVLANISAIPAVGQQSASRLDMFV